MKNRIKILQASLLIIIPIGCYSQYLSGTTDQIATTYVLPGTANNPIIRVGITVGANPVTFNSMVLMHNGCTNPGTDIGAVKIYYTGNSNVFSTNTLFATYMGPPFPVPSFSISGNTTLNPGINYLWLTYDINAGAIACDYVDAYCLSVVVNGAQQIPSVQNPAGAATITNCATSVNNLAAKNSCVIFLSPVTHELTVKTNNNELSEITVYDISSRELLQQQFTNSVSLNTSQLAKGIYIYEVRNKNGVIKKGKVVKE